MHKATQVREHSKLALRWPSEGEGKGHFVCVSVCVFVCVCVCPWPSRVLQHLAWLLHNYFTLLS